MPRNGTAITKATRQQAIPIETGGTSEDRARRTLRMIRGGCKASERRRHVSDSLSEHQDQALSSSIYLLRQIGPTGFLLREEEPENGDFRVLLGNPHECNCSTFLRRGELCKHICWVLLKKFKLPRNHESAFQLGLVEGEINDLLRGIHQVRTPQLQPSKQNAHVAEDGSITQKDISAEDICPICQEVLLEKKLPVTFCRFGCGNNVHIKCMKILAGYQDLISNTSMLKCPLCREEFAPLKLILEEFKNAKKLVTMSERERLDRHLGIPCNNCKQLPIEGKCYKCMECIEYHLCQECFDGYCHLSHVFAFREKRNQRWRTVGKRSDGMTYLDTRNGEENKPCFQEKQGQLHTPKHVVKVLPLLLITKNSKWLAPGYQCRLCLKSFCLGQYTRLLPCTHKLCCVERCSAGTAHEDKLPMRRQPGPRDAFKWSCTHFSEHYLERINGILSEFHRKCIDNWLFHKGNSCPIDRQVIYNPLTWKDTDMDGQGHELPSNTDSAHLSKKEEPKLFIPGTGLILKQNRTGILPSIPQCNSKILTTSPNPSDSYQDITIDDLYSVKLDNSDSRKLIYEYKVNQHFHRCMHVSGSCEKIPSQTFLPSLAHKNIICLTGGDSPYIHEKYDTGQSQKTTKGCKYINLNAKKTLSTKIRQDRRSSTLPPEGLNLTINCGMTKLSLSKRNNNCTTKVRQKCSRPPRRPAYRSLQTQSSTLSLILEGVQL